MKQDKGLPRFADETAKLALVNPEFLVNGLQEHSLVRCPKCSGEVELTYKTSYHGLVLHVRCTKYIEAQVDVCETTKEKAEAGRLDVEAVQRAMAVGSEYFGVCDYNEVLVTSKRLQTWKDEVKAVLFGESDNAPNVNCLLEADFFLPIACSLGFVDYTQYRLISESFLFRQQQVHRNIFYKISAEIFDTVRGEQRFGKHTQIVKKIVRGIDEFRAVEKNLSMDTTFSQRRDANFSFTCLMGRELGFVYSAKVLSKVETELKAVQLEGEASRLLVDQALQEKRDGKGPDWRGICTDGHIENAAMFVELLGKYLDEKAVDARVVGLSDCGEENCGCFSKGSREAICGKHAQERDMLLVSYLVQVGSEIFLVNEKQIVSFPGESIDTGADVRVVLDQNDLVEHLLDLWHVLKSIEKGIRERVEFLKDKVCTQKVHVVVKCLKDTLWKSLSPEGEGLAFHKWLRVGTLLGSLEETEGAIPAKLVRCVDEYIFGNDVDLAGRVQK